MLYSLTPHHIGCVTESIEHSKKIYATTLGFDKFSEVYEIHEQKVKVCFVEIREGFYVEFVEPVGNNPSLNKILKSGNPFYHMGYLTDDIDAELAKLIEGGCYFVNTFLSEAFNNKKCAFVYTPEMQLIELIQK